MSSVFYVFLRKMGRMGFKENLKAELAYKNMLVKELASISGVNRRTIDNYLRENGSVPSADAAARIAAALGVTVEYLITGQERQERNISPLSTDVWAIVKNLESLNRRDQKIVSNLIKSLREMESSEKNA
jgi:transcriptional regulator with XRE-family HTH domain